MRRLQPLYAFAAILILPGLLPGCAVERKCGLDGCPGDAKITQNVQALINQHDDLGPPNIIQVQTLDHVVYLSGEVSASEFSAVAESAAHGAPGVVRVVNSIAVTH